MIKLVNRYDEHIFRNIHDCINWLNENDIDYRSIIKIFITDFGNIVIIYHKKELIEIDKKNN